MFRESRYFETIALAVYVLCFTVATWFHASDLIRWGWLPYTFAPTFLNWFWTLLTVADPLIVLLLLAGRRRTGLGLALVVMILDVVLNSYAMFGPGCGRFPASLQMQSAFLGFVLGSIGFLWKPGRPAPSLG